MILQLFLSLVVMALFAFIVAPGQGRRAWSAIMFVICAVLMYHLWSAFQQHDTSQFVYPWIPYPALQANFNLSANLKLEQMLLPLLGTALLLIYLNCIYKPEEHKLRLNGLVLLSGAAVIVLASSRDFIQLMSGSCCFTILGFYLIDNIEAKKKFIFYNFIAEMALFTALSVVYSRLGSIALPVASNYAQVGEHKDLVAALLLLVIFIKAGLFMFQNQMLDLQVLTFNRVICLSALSTPLSALILFNRLRPLLMEGDFTVLLLQVFCGLSLLWGFFGSLIIDNIKAKALYLNLMFYSFALGVVFQNADSLYYSVAFLLPAAILLNVLLMINVISASNEVYVSQMGGFFRHLKLNFFLVLLGVFAFIAVLGSQYSVELKYYYGVYGSLVLVALAHIFRDIFWGEENADERVAALLQNVGAFYWLPLGCGCIAVAYLLRNGQTIVEIAAFGCFVLLMLLGITRFFNRWADNETVQDMDVWELLYHYLLLTPLRLLGRILWIAVDFVVIERTIIGSISQTTRFFVGGLHRIQSALWLNYLLMVMLGLAIVILTIGYYWYE